MLFLTDAFFCLKFGDVKQMESLATPVGLKDADTDQGLDSRNMAAAQRADYLVKLGVSATAAAEAQANAVTFQQAKKAWPSTISELAQNLVLSILRGNGDLCEQVCVMC